MESFNVGGATPSNFVQVFVCLNLIIVFQLRPVIFFTTFFFAHKRSERKKNPGGDDILSAYTFPCVPGLIRS